MERTSPYAFALFLVLALVIIGALAVPRGVAFEEVTPEKFLAVITPLFLIAVFIERALEVFVAAWRGKGEEELAAEVSRLAPRKQKAKQDKAGSVSDETPSSAPDELTAAKRTLALYKADTHKQALIAALAIGVIVSALGVRFLEPLFDPDALDNLTRGQRVLLAALDIAITGALLGGGSDGLHKVINTVVVFFDTTGKNIKDRRLQEGSISQ